MPSLFTTGNIQSFTARVEGNNVWYDIAEAAPEHGGKYECDWSAANDEMTHYVNVVGKHDSSNVMIHYVSVVGKHDCFKEMMQYVNVVGKCSFFNEIFHCINVDHDHEINSFDELNPFSLYQYYW